MKFAALNKQASEFSARPQGSEKKARPTKEAQESGCLRRYHEAMRLQQDGDTDGARDLYCEILESRVMDEASGGVLLRLKFLIFKNLGSIARARGDNSAAVDAYIQAVSVDHSDVTVWYQLAQASCSLGNLLLGRTALEEALKCQALYWPAIDLLSTVLYALEDSAACLQLIERVLEHRPDFPRGLAYLHQLAASSPDLLTFQPSLRLHLMKPHPPEMEQFIQEAIDLDRKRQALSEVSILEGSIIPPKTMPYYSLYSLGKNLASIYHHCQDLSRQSPSLATPVDLQALCIGTIDRPLLPLPPTTPVTDVMDVVDGEECAEGGRKGEEGGRREMKRKTADPGSSLLPKRRSTRVKTKRDQALCPSERLAHFLPDCLRGCEFGDVTALPPLPSSGPPPSPLPHIDQSNTLSLDSTPRFSDTDVVKTFLKEHEHNSGIINLVYNYLLLLAQHYNWKWAEASFPVVRVYIELYELVHPHLVLPSPLCTPDDSDYTGLQDMAMICQCYSELKLEALQQTSSSGPLPSPLSHSLSFTQLACGGDTLGWKGRAEFTLRVYWCMFKSKTLQKDRPGAFVALQKCKSLLEGRGDVQPPTICLANLGQGAFISSDHVHRKIQALEQALSSVQVYSLFQSGDHAGVVQRLRPMLVGKSEGNSELLLGGSHGDKPLSILLTSLFALDRKQECVECCLHSLTELLLHYKLGNERWLDALTDTFTHLDKCLSEEGIAEQCGEKVLHHLVVCIFKTLELQVEMADSPLLPSMPICLPWKVLYTVLLSVWAASTDQVTMETSPEVSEDVEVAMATEEMITVANDNDVIEKGSPVLVTNQEASSSTGVEGHGPVTMVTKEMGVGLRFLCAAHDYLGSVGQGWCVRDGGCLLKTFVTQLREELRQLTAHTHKTREVLLRELEQCYYCLYGHPHKKAKAWGLRDHGAEQLPLTWESAQVLLEFYHPSFLPAVEENKTLTPELVSLYRRLVDVIPDTGKVVSLEVIAGYIEGHVESLPLPSPPAPHTALVSEIFYLLADDSLKSGDFLGALHNYIQSVCYCPERVDTWAGLALARAQNIMKKLDQRDVRGGMEAVLQKQVTPTLRCFKRALALGSQHRYVREKYGLFCYTIQSYCSQIIAQPHLYSKAEMVPWAHRTRQGLLQLAQQCFTSALSEAGRWPWYYSLVAAKAGMKLGLPPSTTLPLLAQAADRLGSGQTTPPPTVELKGQFISSVEVHYQLHSCALKYLMKLGEGEEEKEEEEGENEDLTAIAEVVGCGKQLPLGGVVYRPVRRWVRGVLGRDSEEEGDTQSEGDAVLQLIQRVIAEAEEEVALETVARGDTAMETDKGPNMVSITSAVTSTARAGLLEQCLYGVAVCSVRCPAYYKSLYRLASTLHSLGQSEAAQGLLLGPLPGDLLSVQDKLQPLFVLRPNIFANFWQIPVDEINRPGRFSSYACRSVQLLCEVLRKQLDSSSLLLLVQHLRSRPDSSRQYLRDYERVAMCQKAIRYCTSVHKQLISEAAHYTEEKVHSLLMETYGLRGLAQRSDNRQHSLTKGVEENMVQWYQLYLGHCPSVDTTASLIGGVEEVMKFCQGQTSRNRSDK